MSDAAGQWTGWLRKGERSGTVVGELVDKWGWRVQLHGTFNEQSRCYELVGVLAEPPEKLRLAALDDAS